MNETSNIKDRMIKEFGPFGSKQIIGLIVAFAVCFVLCIFGWTRQCFGVFIIGVALYMVPHLLGVTSVKTMTVFGAAFMMATILAGAFAVAPAFVDNNSDAPAGNDNFSNITYEYSDDGTVSITATVSGIDDHKAVFRYLQVIAVGFDTATGDRVTNDLILTVDGNKAHGTVKLDSGKLFAGYLGITKTNSAGDEVFDTSTQTASTILSGAYAGSLTSLSLYGCFMAVLLPMIIFFMILYFSAFMRSRFEKTREKLEKEGRLYPQGYGRCEKCGSIVLPGEVSCRKCGTYIDRPEELKPKKKDFFECSECGAEVPSDAKECPKCGSKFDEDEEIIVKHADGTVEVTTETFECSECGAEVPVTASFCPKCGAKFDEDD